MAKRILVTWFGHSDLLAMARELNDLELKYYARAKTGKRPDLFKGQAHIEALIGGHRFDEVHVLSIWDEKQTQKFKPTYEGRVQIHTGALEDPFSFEEAFRFANNFLESHVSKEDSLYLFLSPGTPAMVASLLLLGKTRFPATFFRHNPKIGRAEQFSIPFDIVMDCVTDRLRIPDAKLQGYASITHEPHVAFQDIVGTSQRLKEAIALADRAAIRDVDVLILGESGTGKELFARAIHQASRRGKSDKPFVARNCAAIPETLLESELFGHLKGAFTGASKKRDGAFKLADGGTLFLDEIGEMSPVNQAKLLRVLQSQAADGPCVRRIQPVGMEKRTDEFKVDVRIIAATNRNLQERIKEGAFREDLLYRLAVVKILLPPLRSRPTDIPQIATKVLNRINDQFQPSEIGYKRKRLSNDAVVTLCRRQWPGNIRELEAALKQLCVFLDAEEITAAAINYYAPESPSPMANSNLLQRATGEVIDLKQRTREIQTMFVQDAYRETDSQGEAARLLGVSQQMVSSTLKAAANCPDLRRKK
jgi:DNA-binding NtrC family response regulator